MVLKKQSKGNQKVKKFNCDPLSSGYLDESGDPGKKGTKCLVLTYMSTKESKKIEKILKKTKEQLRRIKKGARWLNRLGGEIKFNSFPDQGLLIKTLEELSKLRIKVMFRAIYKDGSDIPEEVRSYILADLLTESFQNHELMPTKIIADKNYFQDKKIAYLILRNYNETVYEDGSLNEFSGYMHLIEKEELDELSDCNLILSIRHENSKLHAGLQAVDLISGAIFQEMENGDKTYTDILRKHLELKGKVSKPTEK